MVVKNPPGGVQYEVRSGDHHVVVTEVEARLRSYGVGDRDVIVPFGADEIAPVSHGVVLLGG